MPPSPANAGNPSQSVSDRSLKTLDDLVEAGLIDRAATHNLEPVAARYAIAITPDMVRLIEHGSPNDPIRRQFVPDARERSSHPAERADPIGDAVHEAVPGVVHRYPDRVLLKLTHACPVYCRFCFRREMVGPGGPALTGDALSAAIDYIRQHERIFEVILTGGDPLMLSPRRIRHVTQRLADIPHVQVLRWHTRVPVVAPGRVTPELVEALQPGRVGANAACAGQPIVYVGLHANHPRELTVDAEHAIGMLKAARLELVSQTVLLRGINDTAATLETLFRRFVTLGIRPYYLHQADLAPGTAHFRTTVAEGQALMRQLRGRLSGLALPAYVLDIPDGHGKVPVGPQYFDLDGNSVLDTEGREWNYEL